MMDPTATAGMSTPIPELAQSCEVVVSDLDWTSNAVLWTAAILAGLAAFAAGLSAIRSEREKLSKLQVGLAFMGAATAAVSACLQALPAAEWNHELALRASHQREGLRVLEQLDDIHDPNYRRVLTGYVRSRLLECAATAMPNETVPLIPRAEASPGGGIERFREEIAPPPE